MTTESLPDYPRPERNELLPWKYRIWFGVIFAVWMGILWLFVCGPPMVPIAQ